MLAPKAVRTLDGLYRQVDKVTGVERASEKHRGAGRGTGVGGGREEVPVSVPSVRRVDGKPAKSKVCWNSGFRGNRRGTYFCGQNEFAV